MSELAHPTKGRWRWLVLDRLIELVIVFVGIYAAFLLNNYQMRAQDDQRRAQLISYLERENARSLTSVRSGAVQYDNAMNGFLAALKEGKMPDLDIVNFRSGYNPNDTGWILQAGGLELLTIQTIARLREVDNIMRQGLAGYAYYERILDQRITPHLDAGNSYFYNSVTKQLRPSLAFYPDALREGSQFLHKLVAAREQLEAQLHAEQQHGR